MQKLAATFDSQAAREFTESVQVANRPMATKIASSLRNAQWTRIRELATLLMVVLATLGVATMQFYWESLRPYIWGIAYDTKVFAAQVTALVALLATLINISRKR